ncbi:hypothetical protein BDP27DRAFT_1357883 [Rhodocollybia butyracea]|uniref:DUF2423 domain-containing protein n=1 Tax=Rhodocollybia butyracea TaxID=206335 RepID=A0A9P5Q9W0_9AGAR|nr:hypothetical protein BDP27DRAFT_1357883 [Rhodocollybia butyracea]
MAKSLRSKVKREFRSKKREDGVYAVTEAARLHRLNAKLRSAVSKDKDGDEVLKDETVEGKYVPDIGPSDAATSVEGSMHIDNDSQAPSSSKRISTHGPRGSRREEWRLSKGLSAQPSRKGMNRQGGVAARRKAGRSKRRR